VQRVVLAAERVVLAANAVCAAGILFDMDGTLTDSDSLHYAAYRDTILRRVPTFNENKPIEREWYNGFMSGNSNDVISKSMQPSTRTCIHSHSCCIKMISISDMMNLCIFEQTCTFIILVYNAAATLFPDMPMAEQEAMWNEKEALYRDISTTLSPMPGLQRLLTWCDTHSIKLIIVTNAPRLDAVHTMAVLGLSERFGNTIVIGYECAHSKPHPAPYLEGLQRLQLPAENCVAFEDSLNGCRSATAAGLYTIGVLTSLQSDALEAAGAGVSITDYNDPALWSVLNRAAGVPELDAAEATAAAAASNIYV
jgi:HAD superfamily hydrolase (TIGR01509 family)